MSETQTAQFSHEYTDQPVTHEPLTDERLGGLLAAVGNHETKALAFSAMEPGVAYGQSDFRHLYIGMQGPDPVHAPRNSGGPIQYCRESYEPIGMVAKVWHGHRGVQYELTEEGELLGKGVAGHLLAYSLCHPEVSLKQVLGVTSGPDVDRRSPIRRFEILEDLLTRPEEASAAEIGHEHSNAFSTSMHHLRNMQKEGLLTIREIEYSQVDTRYEFGQMSADELVFEDPRERRLATAAANIIQQMADAKTPITREAVGARLREDEYYAKFDPIRMGYRVSLVMKELVGQGFVKEQPRTIKRRVSSVEINAERRAALEEAVALIDALQAADPEFLAEGRRLGAQILADYPSTKLLVRKGLANSPQANGVPLEERMGLIKNYLESNGSATAGQLGAALKEKRITVVSARKTLKQMVDLGILTKAVEKASEGRGTENFYSLKSGDEATSTD